MIKKFVLSCALVAMIACSASAVTFRVGPDYYHGFSAGDFQYRMYTQPPVRFRYTPHAYRGMYYSPHISPYYAPINPYGYYQPRGFGFRFNIR